MEHKHQEHRTERVFGKRMGVVIAYEMAESWMYRLSQPFCVRDEEVQAVRVSFRSCVMADRRGQRWRGPGAQAGQRCWETVFTPGGCQGLSPRDSQMLTAKSLPSLILFVNF